MSEKLPKLIAIVGPTASGKTEAGIVLAKQVNGQVVSADSRQVYVDMNIGTAKPELENSKPGTKTTSVPAAAHDIHTTDLIDGIEHYLLNIRQPKNQLTLAEWQESALTVISHLITQNITPLLVGGTMLYVDSIVFNYDVPSVEVNEQLREDLETKTVEDLYEDLMRRDPEAKNFIQPQNKRRIIRAIEVIEVTGQLFSQQRKTKPLIYDVKMIGIFPGWETLSERIKNRVQAMFDEGLVAEIEKLQSAYGSDLPLLQTINYKEVVSMLAGDLTSDEAMEKMVQATSRYARRQMSWWKGRDDITWIDSPEKVSQFV